MELVVVQLDLLEELLERIHRYDCKHFEMEVGKILDQMVMLHLLMILVIAK
jgi:hypothetical protein